MAHIWRLKDGKTLHLGRTARVMGILNAAPDSFSDGGIFSTAELLARAQDLQTQGADIIDIGGESTHPAAKPVTAAEEQRRVLPVIKALAAALPDMPLSVDTYRAQTALAALNSGAQCVNDVFGLQKDRDMAKIIADTGAGIVIMHTGREREKHPDALTDQRRFFDRSLEIAAKAGISREQIVLDPGFGFAKTEQENIALLRHAEALRQFGLPLLAGLSRKGFLGKISGQTEPQQRDAATLAGSVILRLKGFSLFRAHNVALHKQGLAVADAVLSPPLKTRG